MTVNILIRRAWALACPTRMRAGFPRQAPIAGDRPPRYGILSGPFYRRARACPSPCQRSRGTGPRATVTLTFSFTVGRGPVPRQAPIAGDRPPRYGILSGPFYRRARACPSPSQRSRGKPARMRGWHPRAPALREKTAPFTVGRGPVPRQPTPFTLIPGVEFTEIGTKTGRTGVTIPVVRIFWEFGFAAAA